MTVGELIRRLEQIGVGRMDTEVKVLCREDESLSYASMLRVDEEKLTGRYVVVLVPE
jgi:hypothetical protein